MNPTSPVLPVSDCTDPSVQVVWIRGVPVHLHPLPDLIDRTRPLQDPRFPYASAPFSSAPWWARWAFWKTWFRT
jgi:hypothetical protein